ncbi:hypothetical protein [Mycobacterium intracellulare]|uniref:hypothetical protein n=1 Tax=Mycobacterium intracellulare TaxID=1767 RepID=UPI0001B45EC0|nr:hypothetical protein [Mycobacterium intracellulare]MCA2355664.1 hypothetical protein [Mycobacterium intracellulare]MCA2366088.1 hypothetical protein [Mycobacterium intracellulare]UGU06676.1 hypothetical protein LTQ56_22695 [Mycobacterium intracellulare subsp. intracellulare]BCO55340.1 hypothetical protein MINTM005_05840 [Mycobacterium intracellulare]BCO92604.1 hypothetical protein MINTM016_05800 [Mycobacterium intracellulare]
MRAEEGDESVKDYAKEGRETLGRIKASQHAGGRLGDIARRFAGLWRGERGQQGTEPPAETSDGGG